MHKELIELIMRHLSIVDSCNRVSSSILDAAVKGDVDLLQYESDNRDRIINVIASFQEKIQKMIEGFSNLDLKKENVEVVSAWKSDIDRWIKHTGNIDTKTTEILNNLKEQTTQEIATIFKTKENVKGYNLTSVKK